MWLVFGGAAIVMIFVWYVWQDRRKELETERLSTERLNEWTKKYDPPLLPRPLSGGSGYKPRPKAQRRTANIKHDGDRVDPAEAALAYTAATEAYEADSGDDHDCCDDH